MAYANGLRRWEDLRACITLLPQSRWMQVSHEKKDPDEDVTLDFWLEHTKADGKDKMPPTMMADCRFSKVASNLFRSDRLKTLCRYAPVVRSSRPRRQTPKARVLVFSPFVFSMRVSAAVLRAA